MKKEEVSVSCQIDKKKARIALSPTCNLDCDYCHGPHGRESDKPGSMEDFRATSLETGTITPEQYLAIMQAIYLAGLKGVTFTGGEPMLNPEWPQLVKAASQMGFERVEMTTNGLLLVRFLQKHNRLPEELTTLKVSLDTYDPAVFNRVTGGGNFEQVIAGIRRVQQTNPDLHLRANKVLLRSDLLELKTYLDFVQDLELDEVILLDLILNDTNSESAKNFFEREFVSVAETIKLLQQLYGQDLQIIESRYGQKLFLPSGLPILLKDSASLTLRDEDCYQCPIPCQEGMYTTRVATDGAVRLCYDTRSQLEHVDSRQILEEEGQAALDAALKLLVTRMVLARGVNFFPTFLNKAGVNLDTSDLSS